MTISIVLVFVPGIITTLRILLAILGNLLRMSFLLCALTFGRVFGLLFFIIFVGPVFMIEMLFSPPHTAGTKARLHEKEKKWEGVIDKGELAGWVRVRICNTDSISELELDGELDESGCRFAGSEDGVHGLEERSERSILVDERNRGVLSWLKDLKRDGDRQSRAVVV